MWRYRRRSGEAATCIMYYLSADHEHALYMCEGGPASVVDVGQ